MFTEAEKVDIRRFCGYGLIGSGQPLPASGYRFSTAYGVLEYKLNTLGAAEEAVARTTYLANLAQMELAVVGAGANLDTDAAAVWTHNKNEVRDRRALFDGWRADLCAFLGVPLGPNLASARGGSVSLVV